MQPSAIRNITLLSINQGLLITGTSLILTTSALVGKTLAEEKSLATLPFALLFLTQMATTIPASLFMERAGRRNGFIISALFGFTGACVATAGIVGSSFKVFCIGTVFIGVFNGFGQYYRFAAAEVTTKDYHSRAISYVLAGGVMAAFIGPNLANWTRGLLPQEFAGSYASLILVYLISLSVAAFLNIPALKKNLQAGSGRPLTEIASQHTYVIAITSAMVGYGVMNFIMIATPLAMAEYMHPFSETAFVIQWHIFGMFAPSFFTGNLIQRYGIANVMLAGIILLALCVGVNMAGTGVTHFWASLFSLGLGWNFLFVGATTLLTETYSTNEKAKAQALNDFMVFGTVTLTSFSSGAVHHALGWETINLGIFPFLVLITLANIWLRRRPPIPMAE